MSESRPYKNFDDIPKPEGELETQLAQALGMILLQGMRDVGNIEKFSGATGTFHSEISTPDGALWQIEMSRA